MKRFYNKEDELAYAHIRTLDQKLKAAFKALCYSEGKTIEEKLNELIRRALEQENVIPNQSKPDRTIRSYGSPVPNDGNPKNKDREKSS